MNADQIARELELLRPEVRGFALKWLRNPEYAEDVTQQVMMLAWQGRGEFEGRSAFRSWLMRITRNVCVDHLRHEVRRENAAHPDWSEDQEIDPSPVGPFESYISPEIKRALAVLRPCEREVLRRLAKGHTYEECAELDGVSVNAMKSRIHRARVVVREALALIVQGGDEQFQGQPTQKGRD